MSEKDVIPECQAHALLTLADALEKFDFHMKIGNKKKITITSKDLSLLEALPEINASELRKIATKIIDRENT